MSQTVDELYQVANQFYTQGKYREAMDYYKRILEVEPENYKALKELANCYFFEAVNDKAVKYYQKAVEVNPRDKHVLYNLGLIEEMNKNYHTAIDYYERALEIDPNFDLPKTNLKMVKEIHMWLEGDYQSDNNRRWTPGQDWDLVEKKITPERKTSAPSKKPEKKTDEDISDVKVVESEPISVEEALAKLNELIGLDSVKKTVNEMVATIEIQKRRGKENPLSEHFVFTGNPGTGKTTIARMLAEIFHAIGLLPTSKLVEVDRSQMVAGYIGQTAPKVKKICDEAMGGVLFIDEAYALIQGENDAFGKEAISTLLKRMEDDRGKFVVIVAGYKKEMHDFISSNPGLKSRFTEYIDFPDYSAADMKAIFDLMVNKEKLNKDKGVDTALDKLFEEVHLRKDKNFANARMVRNTLDSVIEAMSMRLYNKERAGKTLTDEELSIIKMTDLPIDTAAQEMTVDQAMEKLNELVGLTEVKDTIRKMIHTLEIQKLRGKAKLQENHYVFMGNPGTGKTTVGRLMSNIFYAIGLLPTHQLIEADRNEMVAGYAGQTAQKVDDLCDRAMGGVLFIDEAYSLKQSYQDDFGDEAINTLLKRMEDDRGKFVVIAAGYPTEMEMFLSSNSGLRSRFTHFIHFPDFDSKELAQIYRIFAQNENYTLEDGVMPLIEKIFGYMVEENQENFANAREVRKLFNETLSKQAGRIIHMKQEGIKKTELKKEADIIKTEDVFVPPRIKLKLDIEEAKEAQKTVDPEPSTVSEQPDQTADSSERNVAEQSESETTE